MAIADLESAAETIPAEEIDAQLLKMLDSHHFCHSHRYPALLKYLVEQTQRGNATQLKERLVGVEVFHRAPDYDTNTDPVVRVTAAEVRKRIAQYYQEPEHGGQVRIDLPTGSYVPRFSRIPAPSSRNGHDLEVEATPPPDPVAGETIAQEPPAEATPATVQDTASRRRIGSWAAICAALVLGALLAFAATRLWNGPSFWQEHALHQFWTPFSTANQAVMVVIGDHTVGAQGNALRASQGTNLNPSEDVLNLMNDYQQINFSDVKSLFKVTNFMVRHEQGFNVTAAGSADIADLREGPVLLFAGLDNRWTMRLTDHLRFRFVDSPDDSIGTIEDTQTPGRYWQVDFKVPYNKLPMDYALVARYFDPLLEQPVMIVAGIGETGTVSASEFVTSERLIEDMNRLAPKNWKRQNLEVVLALPVIDGHAGPPHIVACQFW